MIRYSSPSSHKSQSNFHIIYNFQFVAMFTIATSIFDIYCLAMAAPGSTHYGYFLISYEFVYVGNRHGKLIASMLLTNLINFFNFTVRNALIMFALFSLLLACVIFVTSVLLVVALRKVIIVHHFFNKNLNENQIIPLT